MALVDAFELFDDAEVEVSREIKSTILFELRIAFCRIPFSNERISLSVDFVVVELEVEIMLLVFVKQQKQ